MFNIRTNFITNKEIKISYGFNSFRNLYNFLHKFHIIYSSPWPLFAAITSFNLVVSLVFWFTVSWFFLAFITMFQLTLVSICWFQDILNESIEHTNAVRRGFKIGMFLFIISECLFFFSFFWSYICVSLSPAVELGCCWPGVGLLDFCIKFLGLPLLNTTVLILSGIVLTYAHKGQDSSVFKYFKKFSNSVKNALSLFIKYMSVQLLSEETPAGFQVLSKKATACIMLMLTLSLATSFTLLQSVEYLESLFFISDGVFGSTFFLLTGFHGLHVIIGSLMLLVCFYRLIIGTLHKLESIGLLFAIWYWHFVDLIWILLYLILYVLGSIPRVGGIFTTDFVAEVVLEETPTPDTVVVFLRFECLLPVLVFCFFCVFSYFNPDFIQSPTPPERVPYTPYPYDYIVEPAVKIAFVVILILYIVDFWIPIM